MPNTPMNMSPAQFGSSGGNPGSWLSQKVGQAASSRSNTMGSMIMQRAQHEHEERQVQDSVNKKTNNRNKPRQTVPKNKKY